MLPSVLKFDELVESTEMQVMDAFDNYVAALAKVDAASAQKIENIEYAIIAKEGIIGAIKIELPDLDTGAIWKKVEKADAKIAKLLDKAKKRTYVKSFIILVSNLSYFLLFK